MPYNASSLDKIMSPLSLVRNVLILCASSAYSIASSDKQPTAKLANGIVRGVWKESPVSGKRVRAFLGIPYAQPPLGNSRFKPPLEAKPWDGILNATEVPASCVQKKLPFKLGSEHLRSFFPPENEKPSEDCLYLEVYVPEKVKPKTPVVIWIYGGGFARGSTKFGLQDGVVFTAETDVITIFFNYRLTIFGFLYLDHPSAPGNVGLMDQVMVLKWVARNIEAFGGDPERVTLSGYSAGASSVGFHLLSAESRAYFRRAILQSGTPQCAFATENKDVVMERSLELAANVGCPSSKDNITAVVDCLTAKDSFDLLDNQPQFGYDHVYLFRPVVDGRFLKTHPMNLIKNATHMKSIKKDVISGIDKDESSLFLAAFYPLTFTLVRPAVKATWEEISFIMEEFFGMYGLANEVIRTLYGYAGNRVEYNNPALRAIMIGTDVIFTCPGAEFERALVDSGNKVYKYYFVHRPEGLWEKGGVPDWIGAHHGLELLHLFGKVLQPARNYSLPEINFSKRMMDYWGNFIKTGNPNMFDNGETGRIHWPVHTLENEEYLVLAPNSSATGKFLRKTKCMFWDNIVPKLMRLQGNTTRGQIHILPDL